MGKYSTWDRPPGWIWICRRSAAGSSLPVGDLEDVSLVCVYNGGVPAVEDAGPLGSVIQVDVAVDEILGVVFVQKGDQALKAPVGVILPVSVALGGEWVTTMSTPPARRSWNHNFRIRRRICFSVYWWGPPL